MLENAFKRCVHLATNDSASSGEDSPTFGHANANFSVFIFRIKNQFLMK